MFPTWQPSINNNQPSSSNVILQSHDAKPPSINCQPKIEPEAESASILSSFTFSNSSQAEIHHQPAYSLGAQIVNIGRDVQQLERTVEEKNEALKRYEEQMQERTNRISQLEVELAHRNQQQREAHINSLVINLVREEREELRTLSMNLTQENKMLEQERDGIKEKINAQEKELKDAQMALKAETKQLADMRKRMKESEKEAEAKEDEIGKIGEISEARRQENLMLRNKLKQMEKLSTVDEESTRKKEDQQTSSKLNEMSEHVASLEDQLNSINGERDIMQNTIKELENSNIKLKKELESARIEHDKISKESAAIQKNNRDLTIKLRDSPIAKMINENEKYKEAMQAARTKEMDYKAEISNLRDQLQLFINEQMQALHADRKSPEVCELVRKLQLSNANLRDKTEQLEAMREEFNGLKVEIDVLKTQSRLQANKLLDQQVKSRKRRKPSES